MHFVFFSYKENQPETIELKLSRVGWFMEHPCYSGTVFPSGMPHIQHCLQEHYATFPTALGDAFEELWEAAVHDHLSDAEIQESLDEFSHWVMNLSLGKDTNPSLNQHPLKEGNSQRWRSPA